MPDKCVSEAAARSENYATTLVGSLGTWVFVKIDDAGAALCDGRRRIRFRLAETVSNDQEQPRRRIEIQIVSYLDAEHQALPWPTSLKAIRNPRTDVAFSGRCMD